MGVCHCGDIAEAAFARGVTIATGHLLREVIYPPQTVSQPAADRTVTHAYNA